ncbi:MAG: hypothetical protein HKN76_04680 [Saprospiraceae bacterium]|nr:hypothetical protein [Saprospiraceae bacterium]
MLGLALCILVPLCLSGQSYFTAMGLRMGTDFGITLQQKILGNLTMEGIVSSSAISNQTSATVLAEIHNPLISKRFNFYIGGGIHQRWRSSFDAGPNLRGITGIAGAEMTLGRINLAWDYKPVYHLNAQQSAFESETAISLRYVFVRKLKNKKRNNIFKPTAKQKRQKEKKKLKRQKARNKNKQTQKEKNGLNIFKKK